MSSGGDGGIKAVITAVAVNFAVMIAKFIGFLLTGSPAMLAEAIHSTADVGNQLMLWVGITQSARKPTHEVPDGYGAQRYIWNLMSAMGIFFVGSGVTVYHGMATLLEGFGHREEGLLIGIGILVFSLIVEGLSFQVALKEIRAQAGDTPLMEYIANSKDPTTIGILMEDALAVVGVGLALIGVAFSALGYPIFDAVSSVLIGLLLGVMAIYLAATNARLLTGSRADAEVEERLREVLEADEVVEKVTKLTTRTVGFRQITVRAEVEIHGSLLIAHMRDAFEEDIQELREGASPGRILTEVVDRTTRLMGREFDRLEQLILKTEPSVIAVNLEVN